MSYRMFAVTLAACGLAGCSKGPSVPSGGVLVEETVALTRGPETDSAQRLIEVDGGSVIVAFVEENLTDVSVELAVDDPQQKSVRPVTVENRLRGSGVEVAALDVPRDARVRVTLSGPQNATEPGSVTLRVRRFDADPEDAKLAARLSGYRAWGAATQSGFFADEFRKTGLLDLDRAITQLEGAQGEPALAAEARLVKANVLHFFQIDFAQARSEALAAAAAFAALGRDRGVLGNARAQWIEALALAEVAQNPAAVNPTRAEADAKARAILAALSSETSPFGAIERARAIDALGYMEQNAALLDESRRHFEDARDRFKAVGYVTGEVEMLANLAHLYVERGQFNEGAKAYDLVLPNIHRISDATRRVRAHINAGRAQAFSGRSDEGIENLLKAIAGAHDFKLSAYEGSASQELGFLYNFRGDWLQAKAFFTRALNIARADTNQSGLAVTLQSAGSMARQEGDYSTAIEMHREAVELATNPILRMRNMRHLSLDYQAAGRHEEAITEMRNALATKLQDPNHQAYSDLKRDLAEMLIEHGDGSRATHAEAAKLLAETLAMCLRVQDKLGEIGAHRVKAALLARQGKHAAARTEYEEAFALIFKYRRSSVNDQFRTQSVAHEQAAFRGYFDLMMRDAAARGTGEARAASAAEEDTLRMLELARESHLGMARGQMDAATAARVDGMLAQMAEKSLTIAAMLKQELDAKETVELDTLQLEMSGLRAQVDRERIAAASALSGTEAAGDAQRPWRVIAPGAAQVSYALGNDHAYAWVRDARGMRVAVLSETPEVLEQELTELASFDAQLAPGKIEQAVAHISDVLLPAGLLPADSSAVEVVAEGRIASVPFAGLRSPADPAKRLVETHAITMITSLFPVEEAPRPQHARPFRLVALASGTGTLRSARVVDPAPKLQAATKEIKTVAALFAAQDRDAKIKLLTGAEGNAAALRNMWGSGADVVHFATHALADLRQPLASLLVLPAKDADGTPSYLTAGQVENWRGDAELVFLSTCESALGPPRFAGGMPGLQRAFLRAGARGVIATLWPIEDVLAQQFSADFYQRFVGGKAAVQALRETQRAWLTPKPGAGENELERRRITALAHAYYAK